MSLARQLRRRLTFAVSILLAAFGILVNAAPASAHTWTCVSSSANITDSNTKWNFTTKWTCETAYGAPLYAAANTNVQTAIMYSTTTTWLLCYRRGAVHGGGNNVWYYTQGDAVAGGQGHRNMWGYMPAQYVYINTDPWPGMAQCPEGHGTTPPTRTNDRIPVLMVHGYVDPTYPTTGFDCDSYYWQTALSTYMNSGIGYTRDHLKTIRYYTQDTDCDADLGTNADRNTPIEKIANDLAWYIWNNYTRYGEKVDVLGHSMGGLITRAAIVGVNRRAFAPYNAYLWPGYLYIEDVATLGTPYEGGNWTQLCGVGGGGHQCNQLKPSSAFLYDYIDIDRNPQAATGTDWTFVASLQDFVVNPDSALEWTVSWDTAEVGHKVMYQNNITHMGLVFRSYSSVNETYHCDYFSSCSQHPEHEPWDSSRLWNTTGWVRNTSAISPLRTAAWANYYYDLR
jgi:hypothetical protein